MGQPFYPGLRAPTRGVSPLSPAGAGARSSAPSFLCKTSVCAAQRQFRVCPGAFHWKLAFLPGAVCVRASSPRASLSITESSVSRSSAPVRGGRREIILPEPVLV